MQHVEKGHFKQFPLVFLYQLRYDLLRKCCTDKYSVCANCFRCCLRFVARHIYLSLVNQSKQMGDLYYELYNKRLC